jgi:hypothetical protein
MYIVRDGDTTIAFDVHYDPELGVIPFAGSSKKDKHDPENTLRGENIAIGRAYRNLGRKILKHEYQLLKEQFTPKIQPRKKVSCPDTIVEFEGEEIETLS